MKISKAALTSVFALLLLSGCGEKIRPGEEKAERPVVTGVAIEEVTPVEVTEYYETTGTVRAVNTSLVAAKIMGEVKEIKVKASERVRRGAPLIEIYSPEIEARYEAAEQALGEAEESLEMASAQLKLAEKTYARFKSLYEEKAVSGQEFDEISTEREVAALQHELAKKSLKRAEAMLNEAKAFREFSVIRSPINGIVAEKMIDAGSMTSPGVPLLMIEEPMYRVEVPVDEGMLSSIETGTPVKVRIDALNIDASGKVGEIVRRIESLSRTFIVKIDLDENIRSLRGGFYAKVEFPVGKISKLFVPMDAVVTRGELKGVYTVDLDNVITFRMLNTGREKEGMAEVLSGVNSGDRIIVRGLDKAVDGGKVSNAG